jgi:hypothetical protein
MENVGACDFMLAARGEKGFITGKSVHNQRVERLWRDLFERCICCFTYRFM